MGIVSFVVIARSVSFAAIQESWIATSFVLAMTEFGIFAIAVSLRVAAAKRTTITTEVDGWCCWRSAQTYILQPGAGSANALAAMPVTLFSLPLTLRR